MSNYRSLSVPSPGSCVVSLIGLVAGILTVSTAVAAGAEVDFNKANDYYAAVAGGSGRHIAVEQFHLGPGVEHLRKREYSLAFSEFLFILKIFPNHPRALPLMVEVCEQWKSPYCVADEFFEKAISINPNVAGTFMIQGIHLYRTHQYLQAIQSFKQALAIDSNSMNAHYDLGLTYLETKQFELANEHAQRAYALGAPLPGLRNKLERAGQWKPMEQTALPEPPPGTSTPAGGDDRHDEAVKQ